MMKTKHYKQGKNKNTKARRIFLRLLTVGLTLALIGILSLSVVGTYMFYNVNKAVNGSELLNLNEYMLNQSQTTIVYTLDENGEEVILSRLHGEINRIWVESNEMPDHLKNAFIALEDKRFWDHPGVDWRRTTKALIGAFAPVGDFGGEGGSTITQQLVKNLTGDNGQTFIRKFNEILKALNVTRYFSRDTILATYLNTLYLDEGCYGVETAAEYYFGKTVQELNIAESACLASITKAPRAYNPIINFESNRDRQRYCIDLMFEQGLITEEEFKEAKDYELILRNSEKFAPKEEDESQETEKKEEKKEKKEVQSFYVDFIVDQVIEHLQDEYGYTRAEAFQKVYYGGLKIHAAVDLKMQSIMEDIYYNRKGFPKEEDTKANPAVQSAMAVVDYEGRLLGIIGQAGEKTANRVLNIASQSPRQPGSSIKPISVYAPGINEKAIHWSSKILDYGFNLNGTIWPRNYDGPGSNTYKTVQVALPPSLNTIPAQILRSGKLPLDTAFNYLQDRFHISTLKPEDKDYSPLAVGGMAYGVTALDMAAAFAVFGNGGKYYEPYSYYTVTNYLGNQVILSSTRAGEQVIDPSSAEVMFHLLKTVVTGAGTTVRQNYVEGYRDHMYAKTGTTTDDKDRWFVGATPHAVAAVWYGYKTPKRLPYMNYNPSSRLFKSVMDEYHKGLDKNADFPFEPGSAIQRRYCTSSGNLASATCASTAWGWYRPDFIPSTCVNCYAYGGEPPEETTDEEEDTTNGEDVETSTGQDRPTTTEPPTEPPTFVVRPPEHSGDDEGEGEPIIE